MSLLRSLFQRANSIAAALIRLVAGQRLTFQEVGRLVEISDLILQPEPQLRTADDILPLLQADTAFGFQLVIEPSASRAKRQVTESHDDAEFLH